MTEPNKLIDIATNILSQQPVLGVDIEQTDSTYHGQICLVQISYLDTLSKKIKTVVIDPLTCFSEISSNERREICSDFLG